MIGKSMRSDDNFGSVLHRRHTTVEQQRHSWLWGIRRPGQRSKANN